MRIITQIISVIAICFIVVTAAWSVYFYTSSSYSDQQDLPYIYFSKDLDERTLTVVDTKNIDLNWDDVSIHEGEANLPSSGVISINDVITDCYGLINFKLPDGSVFGGWEFSERPFVYSEDIRFIGEWEGDGQEINFYPNGTYYNTVAFSIDGNTTGGSSDHIVYEINAGNYYQDSWSQLKLVDVGYEELDCAVEFYNFDTQMNIQCAPKGFSYNLTRNFTDDLYITILNASGKLDTCLSYFIMNYSNATHKDVLSEGFNTTVVFTNEITQENINNLTSKNIVFNKDEDENIIYNGFNYSVRIDTLQDLYYLVSRVDVDLIIGDDSKFNDFGCSI